MNIQELEDNNLALIKRYEAALEQSKVKSLCVNSITEGVQTNSGSVYTKEQLLKIVQMSNKRFTELFLDYAKKPMNELKQLAKVNCCMYFEKQLYIEVTVIDPKLEIILGKKHQISPRIVGKPPLQMDDINGFRLFI